MCVPHVSTMFAMEGGVFLRCPHVINGVPLLSIDNFAIYTEEIGAAVCGAILGRIEHPLNTLPNYYL